MTLSRATVFSCDGVPVRVAARREGGKVLVEYLQPRTHAPLASWREAYPHQLRAPGADIGAIKSLVVTLPLARFADDGAAVDVTAVRADPASLASDYWWDKL